MRLLVYAGDKNPDRSVTLHPETLYDTFPLAPHMRDNITHSVTNTKKYLRFFMCTESCTRQTPRHERRC